HITIYILDSYKFNFLASIKSPFANFCFNNSIIPVLFVTVYCFNIFFFQYKNGFQHKVDIILEISALITGMLFIMLLLYIYFTLTNKDVFLLLANNLEGQMRKNKMNRVNVLKKYNTYKKNKIKVDSYIALPFRISSIERNNGIDKLMIIRIFDQNHLNAVIVEFFLVAIIILLGLFRDNPLFQIPAAASSILLFSMIVMFTGAFSYWLKGWSLTVLAIVFVAINMLSKYNVIDTDYQVYGINYKTSNKASYSLQSLNNLTKPSDVIRDKQRMIHILNNWKAKFPSGSKPKMVFICVSGGGQRAALWTLNTLQYVDNELNGDLMKHAILITGASGGMIGASYYRELYLQKQLGKIDDVYSTQYLTNISKDMLNPVIFSLVVNDLFFRFQKFTDGKYEYMKDRGYAFEQTLNRNTDYVFNKTIADYREHEATSIIPMVILSPTIVNDGRKLFISPQDLSFMSAATTNIEKDLKPKIKGVEFRKLFASQDADNLHYLSALRMVATFPYVTPNVQLPSEPTMEIMDAGLADNFGINDATRFLYEFQDWVEQNTGGVVFVDIRDSEKESPIEDNQSPSAWQKISSPISSLYSNWDYFQDLSNDNVLQYAQSWLNTDLDVIEFEYIPKSKYWHKMQERKINPEEIIKMEQNERAALSWHLTTREKESLVRTILESNNQASLSELKRILLHEPVDSVLTP
ncbi:MAG TPA: patatin-like phospholipase family protein, partial [Cytophagaceae bacterium]|nr:patatin-like phospholipase family protein [Cytophagaceae bacterium]